MTYYLGIVFVCFNIDCYFLQAPELFTDPYDCYSALEEQLNGLTAMGFDPAGECFEVKLPGVEI